LRELLSEFIRIVFINSITVEFFSSTEINHANKSHACAFVQMNADSWANIWSEHNIWRLRCVLWLFAVMATLWSLVFSLGSKCCGWNDL